MSATAKTKRPKMQHFPTRPAAILLLIALVTVLLVRGVVPALSKIQSDFPDYLTAAKIVADGGEVGRLYDNVWFQDQMRRYGTGGPAPGKFAPFPPPTALLLLPLVRLAPLDALRVTTGVSILCLAAAIVLLERILAWSLLDSAIFVLLSGYGLINALRFGQPYVLVSLSCIAGYYSYLRGRRGWAGASFGLFAPIKYYPLVFLLYFASRAEWRVVFAGSIVMAGVIAASIAILGWPIHQDFLGSILGNHLIARLSLQDPFTASFQSFDTLFRRLFVLDPALNPHPLLDAPRLQGLGVLCVKTVILLATLIALVRLARRDGAAAIAPSIGLLGVVTLLLAPATASYHFVLLWLPVALLIDYCLAQGVPVFAYLLLGSYALIGFFPYGHALAFEGRGALTLLAYPRLFLCLALFVVGLYVIWTGSGSTRYEQTPPLPAY